MAPIEGDRERCTCASANGLLYGACVWTIIENLCVCVFLWKFGAQDVEFAEIFGYVGVFEMGFYRRLNGMI